jgi:acyl carrier protein
MPLTPNGKLDRSALPAPEQTTSGHTYDPPRGNVEEVLAAIWQELLHIDQIGRRDNFFELGGHSLLATRTISRIRELLKVELPLEVIFESPTIEKLAVRAIIPQRGAATRNSFAADDRARELYESINEMDDEEVLAQVAALERELRPGA